MISYESKIFLILLWWVANLFIRLSHWFSNTGYFWVDTKIWNLNCHKYTTSRIQIEHMSITFATWGALLFITDNINWKPRPTLDVKKEKEPDSSFIEIFQKRFQLYYIKSLTERFIREKNKEVIPLSIPTDAINLFEKIRIRKSSHLEGQAM